MSVTEFSQTSGTIRSLEDIPRHQYGGGDSSERIHAVTARMWDFDPIPLPKGDWMKCPICRAGECIPKQFLFHVAQPGASLPYRCDATFKCRDCAAVWSHGIVVPGEVYDRFANKNIERAQIRELLKGTT